MNVFENENCKVLHKALYYQSIRTGSKVGDPIPDYILDNPKLFPFFEDALGAINGSHFNTFTAPNRDALHNCNGALTTNALAICNFTM